MDEIINLLKSPNRLEHKLAFKLSSFNKDHIKFILGSDEHSYLHEDILAHELVDDQIYSHLFSLPGRSQVQLKALETNQYITSKQIEILYDMVLSYPLNDGNFELLLAICKHSAISATLMYKIMFQDLSNLETSHIAQEYEIPEPIANAAFDSNNDALKIDLAKNPYMSNSTVTNQITKRIFSDNLTDMAICKNLLYTSASDEDVRFVLNTAKSIELKMAAFACPGLKPETINEIINGGDYLLIGAALNSLNANYSNFFALMNSKDENLKKLLKYYTNLLGQL